MAFQKIALCQNHPSLELRWRDDQLRPLLKVLAPYLPPRYTDNMRLAVASVARSLVIDYLLGGRGVRYSRAKPFYRPWRYRNGDRLFSHYFVTRAVDALRSAGLIEHEEGQWWPGTLGLQSVAVATTELVELLGPLIDVSEPRMLAKRVETVVLRDLDKNEINYAETDETVAMRNELALINAKLSQHELRHRGEYLHTPSVRRIFNGSFERGGRLYCHGSSFQNMPAEQRLEITLIVDGVAHPVVEVDYGSLHIRMAYAEARGRAPKGDPYEIDGFDRKLVKVAVNTLFNAPTKKNAIWAIAGDLCHGRDIIWEAYDRAESVVAAIRRKHRRIKEYFGSDCGAKFQKKDSDMAVQVLTKMIERTGRCPLPMHDSFLVPEIDAEILKLTMTEVAQDHGLVLDLKESRSTRLNTLTSTPTYPNSSPPTFSTSTYISSYYSPPPPSPYHSPRLSFHSSFFSLPSPFFSLCPILPIPSSSLSLSPWGLSYFTMEVTGSDLRERDPPRWSTRHSRSLPDGLGMATKGRLARRRPRCRGSPGMLITTITAAIP